MVRYAVEVIGLVQGVGFRPFVYRLALSKVLSGFVLNDTNGVQIEIEGSPAACSAFLYELQNNPPPISRIEHLCIKEIPVKREQGFNILPSISGIRETWISPDIGICPDCIEDITETGNRRLDYAFTNCTNCGPRFTLIQDVPYDRKNTTMSKFIQCESCQHEYDDPEDRRFHAQPNACPVCGPQLEVIPSIKGLTKDPYECFHEAIRSGQIVALKGIGGYHLVCNAMNESAVNRLRQRKLRYDKPFAVMMPDIETVKRYCEIEEEEIIAITSQRKPIILLRLKSQAPIASGVSLQHKTLGVMLPYTPLHYTLMQQHQVLVMTSGNQSDHPMIYQDNDVDKIYPNIADLLITNNRPIFRRMDDSVCHVVAHKLHLIRRARGFVPEPIPLEQNKNVILAVGAQQKNTFCIAKQEHAILSGHIGDLDEIDTEQTYMNEVHSFMHIFDAYPQVIARDLHPDYTTSHLAVELQRAFSKKGNTIPIFAVQHHHAHFASVLAEHQVKEPSLGFIFDGSGYGEDGTIWGGEVLYGNIKTSQRVGHLLPFSLPGGEEAIREPWRVALSILNQTFGFNKALEYFPPYKDEAKIILKAMEAGLNAPTTTSMGRLFDAVAALLGICPIASYEGQAAIHLEQIIDDTASGQYHLDFLEQSNVIWVDWRTMVQQLLLDVRSGISPGTISLRFHNTIIDFVLKMSQFQRTKRDVHTIALSGGVFQNRFLLEKTYKVLTEQGFRVLCNEKLPCNDGGISYGQAATVAERMR